MSVLLHPLHASLLHTEPIPEPCTSSTLCDCSISSANVFSQKCITGNTEMVAGEYTCIYSIDMYVQHELYI